MCLSKNISIVYADIFKYPTVRELAAVVDDGAAPEKHRVIMNFQVITITEFRALSVEMLKKMLTG